MDMKTVDSTLAKVAKVAKGSDSIEMFMITMKILFLELKRV